MMKTMRRAAMAACSAVLALALSACGGGGGGESPNQAPTGTDTPPTAVIRATALAATGGSATAVQAPVGSTLTLDGSASTSTQGSIASYLWTLTTKPTGSTAVLQNASNATATFVPDVAGSYQFTLQVGVGGVTGSAVLPVTVTAAVPVVNVNSTVSFSGPVTTRSAQPVSLGSVVSLDGSGSADANGGAVTLSFSMLSAPTGSKAALTATGNTARFTPDQAGSYQVRVRATSLSGMYADMVHNFDVGALAPTVTVATSVSTVASSSALDAAVGNLVSLDSGGSRAVSGSSEATWTLLSKPAGSGIKQLSTVSATGVSFVPDVAGTYEVQFALVDKTSGASSFHRVRVNVAVGPTAVVSANVAPVAQAGGPSYVGAVGSTVTLRGGGSYDPNGAALTYSWVMDTRPTGSSASLNGTDTASPTFTPDKDGRYGVTLTVTNPTGLRAVQSLSLYVGSYPPVVVLDRSQVLLLQGGTVNASAAGSYSQGGGTLKYSWALDSRPAGSTATLNASDTAAMSFKPDLAGSYYASVTVTDGAVSAVSGVSITVLSATAGTVPLTYKPLLMRFSKALGKLVVVSANPNQLHLVDPTAGTDVAVDLPAAVKAISLSADGQLAGVLHEGTVSLVDLTAAALIRSTSTGGSHTEVFTANSGIVFLTGQTGGQWVTPPMVAINARTGASIANGGGFANIYGTTRGVMSESLGRLFTLSEGLSPAQIYWNGVNTATGSFTGTNGQAPYWGDYSMFNPLWLSSDDSLLFSASGNYFRTADLVYAGNLGTTLLSISHSASAAEAVALSNSTAGQYPQVLKRYTGSQLFPAADVRLPMIGDAQTYGLAIFHTKDDKRVVVVQTGSNQAQASNVQYFLVLR